MNNEKRYLCRDICSSLINYKNTWLGSCGIREKRETLKHPIFIQIKQCLKHLNIPKPNYSLQRKKEKIPGRDESTPHPKLMPQQNHHHIINISNVQSIYLYNLQKHRQQIKLNVYDQLYHFL